MTMCTDKAFAKKIEKNQLTTKSKKNLTKNLMEFNMKKNEIKNQMEMHINSLRNIKLNSEVNMVYVSIKNEQKFY